MAKPATESDKKHGDILEDVVETVSERRKGKHSRRRENDAEERVQSKGTDFGNVDESDS
jgi:hypothetical protein